MNISIIVAAGKGERLNAIINQKKQFYILNGEQEMFLYSLKLFIANSFDKNILVISKDDYFLTKEILKRENILDKVELVFGGNTRQESVLKAIGYIEVNFPSLDKMKTTLFIHDGDRPLLSQKLLTSLLELSKKRLAIIPCINIPDSVYNKKINSYVNREDLNLVQTPQVFSYSLLLAAFKNVYERLREFKDEGSIVKKYYDDVVFVEGDKRNIKVTDKETLDLACYYLKETSNGNSE